MFFFHYMYPFECAACGRVYARSISPFLLGTGRRRCKKCQEVFADGSREWRELSRFEKFKYLFPALALGWFGAATGHEHLCASEISGLGAHVNGSATFPVKSGLNAAKPQLERLTACGIARQMGA